MILMKTTAAGPSGQWVAGRQYDLSDEREAAFVDGGYAVYVKAPRVETAVAEPATEDAAEATDKPPAKRKSRRRKADK